MNSRASDLRTAVFTAGTAWMTRSRDVSGRTVDRPGGGMAIPLDVAGASPHELARFRSEDGGLHRRDGLDDALPRRVRPDGRSSGGWDGDPVGRRRGVAA